ncbi:hypothetical protein EXIGLDRAFT_832098 [Exidia glandulosa HHB12029]|uniref:BTB domain-containing protein n=1 Tax=Exidia glandulosa HHB12029 TaxID=1314781 RepID=A0A165LZ38_EXIGL|nr:hypothetical protein EXIGLDRAFT_832098 [Exidia glandulosa HHB12029]
MPRLHTPFNGRHPTLWFDDGNLIAQGRGEQTLFKVHRSVLSPLSEVIARLLAPEYPNPLEIPYVSSRTLGHLLEFVYPHQATAEQLDTDDYIELLRASHHLLFAELFRSVLAELKSIHSRTPIAPERRLVLGLECDLPDWAFWAFVQLVYAPGPNMESDPARSTLIPYAAQTKILAARFGILRRRTALATRAEGPFILKGQPGSTAASVCRKHIVELRSEVSVGAPPGVSRTRLAGVVKEAKGCQKCTPKKRNVFGVVVRNVFDENIELENLKQVWSRY